MKQKEDSRTISRETGDNVRCPFSGRSSRCSTESSFAAADLADAAGRTLPARVSRSCGRKARSFLDLCFDPELATEVTLQPIERFDFDAAILFSDILVVPHALGRKVEFVEGEGPRLEPIDASGHRHR